MGAYYYAIVCCKLSTLVNSLMQIEACCSADRPMTHGMEPEENVVNCDLTNRKGKID